MTSHPQQAKACRYFAFSLADAQAGRGSLTRAAWKRQPFRQLPSPIIKSAQTPLHTDNPATDLNPHPDDPRIITQDDLVGWAMDEPFTALIWHPIVFRRTESVRHGLQTHQWAPDILTPISVVIYADPQGRLLAHGRPRFSRECLEPAGHGAVTLGNVDSADVFYEANRFPDWDIPGNQEDEQSERWTLADVAQYAEALFSKVCETDPRHPIPGVRYERLGYGVGLPAGQPDIATKSLLSTYDAIETLIPDLPLFERIVAPISGDSEHRTSRVERLPDLLSRWGTLQSNRQLSPDQRQAMNVSSQLREGEAQAINGPPGTGKTALLQDLIASQIVKAVLTNAKPPLIVIASTNNQAITNALASMALPDPDTHAAGNAWLDESRRNLEQRWIPFWSSLGLYQASRFAQESARSRGHLIEEDMERLERTADLTELSMSFVRKARTTTRDASIATMDAATQALSRRLKAEASQQVFVQALPKRLRQCKTAKEVHQWIDNAQSQFDQWDRFGFGLSSECRHCWENAHAEIVAVAEQLSEGDALSLEAAKANETLNDLWRTDRTLRVMRPFASRQWAQPVIRFRLQRLSVDKSTEPETLSDTIRKLKAKATELRTQAQTSFRLLLSQGVMKALIPVLDQHLQMTARHRWFWLALHIREGQWLKAMSEHGQGQRDKRTKEGVEAQLLRRSLLAPVTICTLHRLPKVFSYWDVARQAELPLFNHIDWLFVDEAGQCAPDVAMASMALARRAVVVGDVAQLEPVWSIEGREDTGNRIASGLIQRNEIISIKNDRISRSGASTSEGNILSMVQRVSAYESNNGALEGLWLTEHRRCVPAIFDFCNKLAYEGRIESRRSDTSPSPLHAINYLDVPGTDTRVNGSRVNTLEATLLALWVAENRATIEVAYKQPISECLAIIAPFRAQAQRIEQQLNLHIGKDHNITVGTVHATQGAQYPIVLLSLTYGSEPVGRPLFFDEKQSMLNVAVSRAMDSLVVAGDLDVLVQAGRPSRLLAAHCIEYGHRLSWPQLEHRTVGGIAPPALDSIREVYGKDALVKTVLEGQPSALTMALTDENIQAVVVLASDVDKKSVQAIGNQCIRAARRGAQVVWVLSQASIAASPDNRVLFDAMETLKSHGIDIHYVSGSFANGVILPDQNLAFRADRSWLCHPAPSQSIAIQSHSRQQWQRILDLYQIQSLMNDAAMTA